MQIRLLFAGGVVALLLAGCGKAAIPHDQMSRTEAEIRAAEVKFAELEGAGPSEGAPTAELHLKLARDQLATARELIEEKEIEEAEGLLHRAEVDARYALALAQEWEAKARAEEALEKVQELKEKAGE